MEATPSPEPRSVARADALVRSGKVPEGLAMAQALWSRLEQGDRLAERADCQRVIALAHQVSGRLQPALLAGYQAIELYRRLPPSAGYARMLSMQAVALVRNGDPAEALNLVQQAVETLPHVDDPAAAARVWNNISVVHEAQGQLAPAVQALERAMPLAAQADDPDLQAVLVCNLWLYRLAQARAASPDAEDAATREALQALARHIADCEGSGRHPLVGSMADALGEALARLGRLDEARAVLHAGLRATQAAGLGPEQARLELRLARAERGAGRHEVAAGHMARALELALQGDDKDVISRCHLEMSQLHEARHEWEAALASFKRHAEVQQALLRAQAETAAQVLTARLEAERNRLQAELLHLRNAELERNMQQLAHQAEQYARDAQHDALTGLGNRRHFELRIAALREATLVAGGQDVVVLMADIDFFKRINDGFSHAVGDEVLRQIGTLLRKHSRPYDLVARLGGEEFVVVIGGGLGLAGAHAVAERIRERVAAHAWGGLRPGLAVTVSLGLAQAVPGEPIERAMERADEALYRAKAQGRNRVYAAAAPA